MGRIAVVTDSTADLPAPLREELGIATIPLSVLWGNETLKDGVDIDAETFYRRLKVDKELPKTSQPSAGEFVDFFRRVAGEQNADTVVGFFISGALSGTISSAEIARGLFADLRIEVIDSLSTSMGLGFQVLAAARAARQGASVEEVIEAAQRVRYRQQVLFVVDTLEFLHRGGRIGGAQRLMGTALQLKPLLELEGGKIEAVEKVRTKRKAVERLLSIALERKGNAPVEGAAVIHADNAEEAWLLQEQAQKLLGIDQVYVSILSPVLGTHTGPGTVGLIFHTR